MLSERNITNYYVVRGSSVQIVSNRVMYILNLEYLTKFLIIQT